jgi:hypothetical protein
VIRRAAIAGVLATACSLLTAVPVGPAAAVGADDTAASTLIVQTSPVGPSGHLLPGYRVAKHLSGATCRSHSRVTGNAYSCHVHFGYDPCWLTAKKAYVVCLPQPYGRKITKLRVARYVNAGGLGNPKPLPWGLQLANGVNTTLMLPGFGTVSGQEINYSFNDFKTVLVGSIDKSAPVWRVREARNVGRFRFKLAGWINIKKAWVGSPTRLS